LPQPDADLLTALAGVSDPEYPLSIVDLGMVVSAELTDGTARVGLTFTSIGCPAIDMITADVEEALLALPGVRDVVVDVVWHPAWTKDRISERGRRVLAMYGVT